eukprot:Selendium_serpulae@DN4501_c0_g1_i1.p1
MDFYSDMLRFQDEMNRLIDGTFGRNDLAVGDLPMLMQQPHHQPQRQAPATASGQAVVPHAAHRAHHLMPRPMFNPRVAISETEKEVTVHADLPGMKKEDIKIHFENGMLELTGKRDKAEVRDTDQWHVEERSHGSFVRTFRLPKTVNEEQINGSFQDGVLTITCPKTKEKKEGLAIKIA